MNYLVQLAIVGALMAIVGFAFARRERREVRRHHDS